ncbi:MAG: hypothetical protein HZB29_12255 [Nitrospinae bacterium]|nr:hypothetical protein [Nitrospinota bacterium]
MSEADVKSGDSRHVRVILAIAFVTILAGLAAHIVSDQNGEKTEIVHLNKEIMDGGARGEMVAKLRSASMPDLLAVYSAETGLLRDSYPQYDYLPTLADVRREMVGMYGSEDDNVIREFIIGGYFFAKEDMRQAARHYGAASHHLGVPSVYLMQALALRTAGEEVASYHAATKLRELAKKSGNVKVIESSKRLLSRFVEKANALLAISLGVGTMIALALAATGYVVARRIRMGKKGEAYFVPLPYRRALARRIQAATGAELTAIELEIDQIREKTNSAIAKRHANANLEHREARKLADVRRELEKLADPAVRWLDTEKDFLAGSMHDAIRDHGRAIMHFNAALEKADLPSFHYMLGTSLLARKNKKGAGRAFQKAVALAGKIEDEAMAIIASRQLASL